MQMWKLDRIDHSLFRSEYWVLEGFPKVNRKGKENAVQLRTINLSTQHCFI